MNQLLTAARDRGVMIIHTPGETMNIYAGTPYRTRMEEAKPATPQVPIERRCDVDPTREPQPLPVDRTLDCDDATLGPVVRPCLVKAPRYCIDPECSIRAPLYFETAGLRFSASRCGVTSSRVVASITWSMMIVSGTSLVSRIKPI